MSQQHRQNQRIGKKSQASRSYSTGTVASSGGLISAENCPVCEIPSALYSRRIVGLQGRDPVREEA